MLKNREYADLIDHEELFAPVFGEYSVPFELKAFEALPTAAEIRRLGEETFLRWLHYHLRGRTVPVRKSPIPLECERPEEVVEYAPGHEVETSFFPDYPEPEDYVGGEDDPEYRRVAHSAHIQTLISKQKCSTCPIAKSCLDNAVIQSPPDGLYGVFGGHDERVQKLIQNRYNKLRRGYSSDKTDDMTDKERAAYEAIAVTLTFD